MTTCPGFTLSPCLIATAVIVPFSGAGTSMTALLVSTSIILWPLVTVSPAFTEMPTTSPESTPSPRLGSLKSFAMSVLQRIFLFGVDAELAHGLGRRALGQLARGLQALQRGQGDALGVHAEEAAQLLAPFAAAEAVGAQGREIVDPRG